MQKTTYKIAKMDYPAEENIVRMKLEGFKNIKALQFNIPNRNLDVIHEGNAQQITAAIDSLNLASSVLKSEEIDDDEMLMLENNQEKNIFITVFLINFSFFVLELIYGYLSNSMGLIADSLDMLADAIIFGISIFVVGKAISTKQKVAKISGYFQLSLALLGMVEVVRRFLGATETPEYKTMMIISSFALIGNAVGLYLIQKAKTKQEAHIQAGKIFLSNDVVINIGVIAAGVLVLITASKLPDLIVGTIVFIIVGRGAYKILKL